MTTPTSPMPVLDPPATAPDDRLTEEPIDQSDGPWIVILYNDDYHDVDEVTLQVQRATGCALETAIYVTLTAHHQGRAVVYQGSQQECERVAAVLRQIRLQAETDRT